MKYNIWNKWDPLKVCMLGNNYAPEFFNGVPDRVGDPLKRICEETLEDLDGFKKIMQDFGIEVIQPEMDSTERFLDNPMQYPLANLEGILLKN
jgi:altronate dehydratase